MQHTNTKAKLLKYNEYFDEIKRTKYIIEKTKNPKCKRDYYKHLKRLEQELSEYARLKNAIKYI